MRASDLRAALLAVALAACAPKPTVVPKPTMDPGRVTPPVVTPPAPPPPTKNPVLPPTEAYRRGLMPLASTNVWAFRQAHPEYDGRGVLIGILDSGIDAGVAGLGVTSVGDPKILDLRDFSGEGRIALAPVASSGDTAVIGRAKVAGLEHVRALAGSGPILGGVLAERPLGELPASDVNGDGTNADLLPVIVAKASDGWVLFADTNGDGSLADEKPVHDFLVARETFGWSTGGRPTPLTVAANFSGTDSAPVLDLFFDTSGHGTHVSGIAAGSSLYGVKGFDGVAPGAQLLGLKIANDALGGISVTGSMITAMTYAIKFAKAHQLPLVLNMSFGVGNEREGAARIDAMIDSVLAANPEVIFATSAGNDGPGLSTVGFPGSADRVISVGATYPPAFVGTAVSGDVLAFFSSRGGESAKPDIVAPGIAYSSVPRWDTGSEDKNGTSMASPHVAGAMALLVSGLKQEKKSWAAAQLKEAIVATGRPLGPVTAIDEGGGLLDLVAADRLARKLPAVAAVRVKVGGVPAGAIFRLMSRGRVADTTITAQVEGTLGGPIHLAVDAGWVEVPTSIQLTPPKTDIAISVKGSMAARAGIASAMITGWATDTTIGPLFRIPVTVVNPFAIPDTGFTDRMTVASGGNRRVFFPTDSGRPFRVTVATTVKGQEVLAFLHEPGGQPFRSENGRRGAYGQEAAVYDVDGRDAVAGNYEAVVVSPPGMAASAEVRIDRSPLGLAAARATKDTIAATLTNLSGVPLTGTTMLGWIGAERSVAFSQHGSAERRVTVRVPAWAKRMVVDLELSRATWPLFTDLGFSIQDSEGQILGNAAMNYAFGRNAVELDSTAVGKDATVVLAPGFAEPNANPLWDGNLSIRFYAETPVLVETTQRTEFTLKPGGTATFRFPLGKLPWPLGDGFFPVGHLVADVSGSLWGREVRLPEPTPPIMR